MLRQGDILLVKTDKVQGKLVGTGRRILAHGEVTGHSHVLDGDVKYYNNGNGLLIAQVHGDARLTHEEHNMINVPEGDYLVIRQREFDVVEGIRRVSD